MTAPTAPAGCNTAAQKDLWAYLPADAAGNFEVTVPLPTAANSSLDADWASGSAHGVRLLTGSIKTGDRPRSAYIPFTVTGTVTPPVVTPPVVTPPVVTPPVVTPPAVVKPAPKLPLIKGLTLSKVSKVKASTSKPKVGKKVSLKKVPKGSTKVVKVKKGKKTVTRKYKVTISYQWYANGKAIKGAKKATYTPTKKYKGKTLSVKISWKQKTVPTYAKTYTVGKIRK